MLPQHNGFGDPERLRALVAESRSIAAAAASQALTQLDGRGEKSQVLSAIHELRAAGSTVSTRSIAETLSLRRGAGTAWAGELGIRRVRQTISALRIAGYSVGAVLREGSDV
jgi:hypothetical protein